MKKGENYIERLLKGADVWNRWRADNPKTDPFFLDTSIAGFHLEGVDFHNVLFYQVDLEYANLRRADLEKACFNRSNLRGVNLQGASLYNAKLEGAYLEGANLEGADLRSCNLKGAHLYGANIRNTRIEMYRTNLDNSSFQSKDLLLSATESSDDSNYSSHITRSIEFPPEYRQAGISILSYFGIILQQKYPDKKVKVRIEQEGLKITMIVETVEGDREAIERTLDEYGLVVLDKIPASQLLPDPLHAMALENKLEMAKLEIRQAYKMLDMSEKRVDDLKEEIGSLRLIVGQILHQTDKVLDNSSETTRVIGGIAREVLRKDQAFLRDMAGQTEIIRNELSTLANKLDILRIVHEDIEEVKDILWSIRQKEPEKYEKIKEYFSQLTIGATGSIYATVICEALKLIQ